MSRSERIQQQLTIALSPSLLIVENESHHHRVPENAETHFKVVAVSESFLNHSRLERHRLINTLLAEEFRTGLHALTLQLHTPSEWAASQHVIQSPPCQHKT